MATAQPISSQRVIVVCILALVTVNLVYLLSCLSPARALAELLPRHTPAKPVSSHLWPGLRDDLVIVKFIEGSETRWRDGQLVSLAAHDLAGANELLADRPDLRTGPLFSRSEAELETTRRRGEQRSGRALADLSSYYKVELASPGATALLELIDALNALPVVEIAYAEPRPSPATLPATLSGVACDPAGAARATAGNHRALPLTPDFQPLQGYLDPAPGGIDAYAAWTYPGGHGEDVRVIDIEVGFNWNHEDMPAPIYEGGPPTYGDHGVAVVGVIAAADNGYGVTGIAHGATIGSQNVIGIPTADAFELVTSQLDAGDVFVIELHCPGPAASGSGQNGYIALEWWQANFDVIAMASAGGIICCEAAGNGAQDFDHPIYEGRFDRSVRDSGAIIVGATNGASLYPASFTNYGSRVDLCGWGYDVVTCGYGNLQGGPQNTWYTDTFSGTSSATPIVTGAVTVMQGIYKAHAGGATLPGGTIAQLLKETGTPLSGGNPIGPRPDLAAAVPLMLNDLASIQGTVTSGGLPLEGVEMRVLETGARRLTAPDGTYALPVTPGNWTVRAGRFGYVPDVTPVTASAGGSTQHDPILAAQPTTQITGRVTDEAGLGVDGAMLTIPDSPLPSVQSAFDGTYLLSDVPDDLAGVVTATLAGRTPDVRAFQLAGAPLALDLALAVPEDFEATGGGLSGAGQWQWGVPTYPAGPTAHSGSRCWGTNLAGTYGSSFVHYLTTPSHDLAGLESPRLSFWHWYEIWGPYDGITTQISTNGGGTWLSLEPEGGYPDPCIDALPGSGCQPGWTGTSGEWLPAAFDLSPYAAATVRFRFVLGPYDYSSTAGWYLDDLQVYGVTATVGVTPLAGAPQRTVLGRPVPSPTAGATAIDVGLATPARVVLTIFDVAGRRLRRLDSGPRPAGSHRLQWDGRDHGGRALASGVYFLQLEVTDAEGGAVERATRKLILTR